MNLDIDECLQNPCGPNAVCMNTIGSYTCECPNKYLARGGSPELGCDRAAVDVACQFDDDCTGNAACINNNCQCRPGYQIKGVECVGKCLELLIFVDNYNFCDNLITKRY